MIATTTPRRGAARDDERVAGLDRFLAAHGPSIARYAISRVGPDAADDVLSRTYELVWRKWDSIGGLPGSEIRAFALGVATNVIARHRRAEAKWLRDHRAANARGVDEDSLDISQLVERVDAGVLAGQLSTALSRLPRRERDPLLLHVLGELSYEEVARALGIPIGTVRSRISRGRSRVSKQLRGRR